MAINKKTGRRNGNSVYRAKGGFGKGDRPRIDKQQQYSDNHQAIDWGRKTSLLEDYCEANGLTIDQLTEEEKSILGEV